MRVKKFIVQIDVAGQFRRHDRERADAFARESLDRQAKGPLFGPRGGRYEPLGTAYDYKDSAEPRWTQDLHTYAAYVDAKYVRPSRSA